jgi:hypothetical protein
MRGTRILAAAVVLTGIVTGLAPTGRADENPSAPNAPAARGRDETVTPDVQVAALREKMNDVYNSYQALRAQATAREERAGKREAALKARVAELEVQLAARGAPQPTAPATQRNANGAPKNAIPHEFNGEPVYLVPLADATAPTTRPSSPSK